MQETPVTDVHIVFHYKYEYRCISPPPPLRENIFTWYPINMPLNDPLYKILYMMGFIRTGLTVSLAPGICVLMFLLFPVPLYGMIFHDHCSVYTNEAQCWAFGKSQAQD